MAPSSAPAAAAAVLVPMALLLLLLLGLAPSPTSADLLCTPWSGALCAPQADGSTQVSVTGNGGGSMQSPAHFIQGYWSMDMKLPGGSSGGINFAWYIMDSTSNSNKDPNHAEIDFEFYGNTSAQNALLTTNVFCGGKQNLVQFRMPFDPSADFHTYAIQWNAQQIVWLVDGTPLRVLNYDGNKPWPLHSMRATTSIWNTPWTALQPNWNTNGGQVSEWVRNYSEQGCPAADNDFGTPGQQQCNGAWNNAPSGAQMGAYQNFHDSNLIVDYNWDNA